MRRCSYGVGTAGTPELWHHGAVTVGHRIARDVLLAAIRQAAPEALALLGVAGTAETRWPIVLGDTGDIKTLVDRLFAYADGIERAKELLRVAGAAGRRRPG